jgi:hypothetical protein
MAYAADTTVPVERTRAAIEKELIKYGADNFISGWNKDKAFVSFHAKDRFVRFALPLPRRSDSTFTTVPARSSRREPTMRSDGEALKRWEQACRSKWRQLLLTIKAKLESTEAGIETFEQAFLAHIVLPDQTLVGDRVIGALVTAYETGKMPMLPPPPPPPPTVAVDNDDAEDEDP